MIMAKLRELSPDAPVKTSWVLVSQTTSQTRATIFHAVMGGVHHCHEMQQQGII